MNPKTPAQAAGASSALFLLGGWLALFTEHPALAVICWIMAVVMAVICWRAK